MLEYTYRTVVMSKVEKIERRIQALSPEELAQFRAWFLEFDWTAWDHQIEQDVHAGKLDTLADRHRRAYRGGTHRPEQPGVQRPPAGGRR